MTQLERCFFHFLHSMSWDVFRCRGTSELLLRYFYLGAMLDTSIFCRYLWHLSLTPPNRFPSSFPLELLGTATDGLLFKMEDHSQVNCILEVFSTFANIVFIVIFPIMHWLVYTNKVPIRIRKKWFLKHESKPKISIDDSDLTSHWKKITGTLWMLLAINKKKFWADKNVIICKFLIFIQVFIGHDWNRIFFAGVH